MFYQQRVFAGGSVCTFGVSGWESGGGGVGGGGEGDRHHPSHEGATKTSLPTRAAREQIFHPRVTFLIAVLSWRDGGGCRNRWL